MNSIEKNINIVLLALCCVLGTVVYMTQRAGNSCSCDHAATSKQISELQADVAVLKLKASRPSGSPLGSHE